MKASDTVLGQRTIQDKYGISFGNEVWKTVRPLLEAQAEISFKAGYEQAEIDRFRGHMIEAELQGDCQREI